MNEAEGADRRREIYALSREYKKADILRETRKKARALLKTTKGKGPEEVQGIIGDVLAVLVEGQAALERLERGETVERTDSG